jgi:class 3 adenylate cyclase/CHASE2 domain-containing sensor protein
LFRVFPFMRRIQATLPVAITAAVIALVALLEWLPSWSKSAAWLQRPEWVTYDLRMKMAAKRTTPEEFGSSPFGFVLISDLSIRTINDGDLGYRSGLFWPKHLYGYLAEELATEGATAAGFDVLFGEERTDQPARWPDGAVMTSDGAVVTSDKLFADLLSRTAIGILASTDGLMPANIFRESGAQIGDISAQADDDGILRRARPFQDYPRLWRSEVRKWAAYQNADLEKAVIERNRIVVPGVRGNTNKYHLPLDQNGHFSVTNNGGKVYSYEEKPFESVRVWHMGVILAAKRLGLDLSRAEQKAGDLFIPGTNGLSRTIPLAQDGTFLINWRASLRTTNSILKESFEGVLAKGIQRQLDPPAEPAANSWSNRLAIIGSVASGNGVTDRGPTPLSPQDFLVGKHWNIADMVFRERYIRQTGTLATITLIAAMALLAAGISWKFGALESALSVLALCSIYVVVAVWLFIQAGWWIPIVLPVGGGMIGNYVALVTYRFRTEQGEKRRVKSVFSKIVSPNIVNELLNTENLKLGGSRRKITVYFSDVRGFTAFMDAREKETDACIRDNSLSAEAADLYRDEQAAKNLRTINSYLATIADTVKRHDGTLDKYMGDCVMAFWGAPTPQEDHALRSVNAAIESQRAIEALNELSRVENARRVTDNARRVADGLPPLPELPEISLGTGINTGFVTVGLMGSDAHILNYTVFGSEVNLASRLEGFSGRGRIIIGEATFEELVRTDPELAAKCVSVEVQGLKGFTSGIRAYEVPWRIPLSA